MYWDDDLYVRRKLLLPFFWNVLAQKGQIFGNRNNGNKVNVANAYAVSYPGYNEMLTGNADPAISNNNRSHNPNRNVLEYLDNIASFRGKVALFSSWDVFPFIVHAKRNTLFVNSGYQEVKYEMQSSTKELINQVQEKAIVSNRKATRYDRLTFLAAKEYLQQNNPRLLFLALGETDEYAHDGRYDLYLQQANDIDRMLGELWYWIQTTEGYRNNTTLIITTDHGRGARSQKWHAHGRFISGSDETWLAIIGPGILPWGERTNDNQLYQQQLAPTIAMILGEQFQPPGNYVDPVSLR